MLKILCVDDEPSTLTMVSRSLENAFPEDEVIAADSGEAAAQILKAGDTAILVTDLVLPGISGMDVLDIARRSCPEIEAIMVTAFTSVENAVEAMRKGARDYIAKPLSVPLLVEKVANLRELLVSRREIEDYRYALSVIEEDVGRSVKSVEQRLDALNARMARIRELVDAALPPQEKLARIAEQVADPALVEAL